MVVGGHSRGGVFLGGGRQMGSESGLGGSGIGSSRARCILTLHSGLKALYRLLRFVPAKQLVHN